MLRPLRTRREKRTKRGSIKRGNVTSSCWNAWLRRIWIRGNKKRVNRGNRLNKMKKLKN